MSSERRPYIRVDLAIDRIHGSHPLTPLPHFTPSALHPTPPHENAAEDSGAFVESAQAFHFDRVFDPTEGQEAVFEEVARPIVDGPYDFDRRCTPESIII